MENFNCKISFVLINFDGRIGYQRYTVNDFKITFNELSSRKTLDQFFFLIKNDEGINEVVTVFPLKIDF